MIPTEPGAVEFRGTTRRLWRHIAVAVVFVGIAACSDTPTGPAPPAPPPAISADEAGAQAAVLVVLAAALGVNAPNLVGTVPCILGGYFIREFDEDTQVVSVRSVGCELISGVRVDGAGSVDNAFLIDNTADLNQLSFTGVLTVTSTAWTRSITSVQIDQVTTEGVTANQRPALDDITVVSAAVNNTNWVVDDVAVFDRPMLTADRTFGSLGSSDVQSLEARHAERIVLDLGGQLAGFFLNELLETQRGDHQHTDVCGVIDVTPTVAVNTTLTFDWTACRLGGGLLVEGDFVLSGNPPFTSSFGWTLTGSMRVGGGVPDTVVEGLVWTVNVGSGDRRVVVNAELTGQGQTRSISVEAFWST